MWSQKHVSDLSCKARTMLKSFASALPRTGGPSGTVNGLFGQSTVLKSARSSWYWPAESQAMQTKWSLEHLRQQTVSSHSFTVWVSPKLISPFIKVAARPKYLRISLQHLTIASAIGFMLVSSTATAQGMVLVMQSDGSLSDSASQNNFARNYNDGVGQGTASEGLRLFGQQPEETASASEGFRVASIAPQRIAPRPEILAAIDETALRYASHPALRRTGLSVTEWRLLFRSNIEIESAYDPNARSQVGAIGLGQLMPETASDLRVDPYNWRQNLDGSARYLLMMLEQFGEPRLALAAYNAGPNAVAQYAGIPPYRETQNHVSRVLAVFNRLEGENS